MKGNYFASDLGARMAPQATVLVVLLVVAMSACSDDPVSEPPPADACAVEADCLDLFDDLSPCEEAFCDVDRCKRRARQDDAVCGPGTCSEDSPSTWRPPRTCLQGLCLLAQAVGCDDGEVCTADTCDVSAGCAHSPVAGPCDDGSKCTTKDVCLAGACTGGAKLCECEIDKDCISLDDGNICNGTLICNQVSNACQVDPSSVIACDGSGDTDCKQAQCDPVLGVCVSKSLADGAVCDDGVDCTDPDVCTAGICSGKDICK